MVIESYLDSRPQAQEFGPCCILNIKRLKDRTGCQRLALGRGSVAAVAIKLVEINMQGNRIQRALGNRLGQIADSRLILTNGFIVAVRQAIKLPSDGVQTVVIRVNGGRALQ